MHTRFESLYQPPMRKRFILVAVIGVCALIATIVALAVALSRRNGGRDGLVVIIGAGAAGASAAAELKRVGQRFLIVEARSQVGGRMTNARFANYSVELGANWIHEYTARGELEKIASGIDLNGVPTDFADYAFYVNGSKVSASAETTRFSNAWAKTVPLAYEDDDQTILKALSKHAGWKPNNGIDCALLQYTVDYLFGLSARKVSAYQVDVEMGDFESEFDPASEYFVTDIRGYSAAVKDVLERAGVNDTSKTGELLMLNSNVTAVEHNGTGARVKLGNGVVLDARAVISTVSLGVLQSNMIQFKPPLSPKKKDALAKMTMGSFTKIYVRFKQPVLTESDPLILVPTNCDRARNVQNLNKKPFFPGSNAVLVTVLGGEGVKGDALGVALTAVNQVVKQNVSREMVAEHVYKNFDEDPFFRGAYSNRLVGFTNADFDELTTPQQSLYLAGEMLAGREEYGSVKEAIVSGKATAQLLLRNI